MAKGPMQSVIQHVRGLLVAEDAAALSDAGLLERFLSERDEAAFEALVRRHGPMVLGLCRRVLQDPHEAEDAFQATFLVFVRKAGSIRKRELLGNWLYGVAYHTARAARSAAARRRAQEAKAMPRQQPKKENVWQELQPLLDQELSRLPEKYRVPIILCDLEEKSRADAARQLGLPEGTLSSRLARGRALLARRLTRRGFALSTGALAAGLGRQASASALPSALVATTVKAGTLALAGQSMATGAVPAHVVALSEGVIKAMFLTKIKIVSAVVLTGGLLIIGVGNVASRGARAEPPAVVAPPPVESNSKTPEVVFRALAKKAAGLGLDIEFAGHTAMEIVKTTKEPDAKWRAVRILGSLRYEPAVPLLLESLSDPHHGVRANAARALGDMKVAAAAKPLTELLKTEADGGVIQQTSLALANLRYSQALPALKAAAKHEDVQTRMWVLQAVGRLGGKRDVPFLAGYLLDDPSSSVQMSAAKAIEQITGADFGFPKRGGIYSPDAGLRQAETWWKEHKGEFRD